MKFFRSYFDRQYKPFLRFLKRYFHDYGGYSAVIGSPLFGLAILTTLSSYKTWKNDDWPQIVQSVIPNLLGFSLGTYALLFSLISPNIRSALRNLRNSRGVRYLDEMNATFLHFILIQAISLIWAFLFNQSLFFDIAILISHAFPTKIDIFPLLKISGSILGILLFSYSVFLVIGSSIVVYRIAKIVDPSDH